MRVFRCVLHGHRVELRTSEWGGEQVLLDGREIANKPMAGLTRPSHFFDVTDEAGRTRHVEIRRIDVSKLSLGRYRVIVNVDGVERCRLEPEDPRQAPDVCANCGYLLQGQPVLNGEVRCPECGRHSLAPMRDDGA